MRFQMHQETTSRRLPKITLTSQDRDSLSRLANAAVDRMPDVADVLLVELERARIVSEKAIKPNIVRMGSTLTYRSDDGAERRVTLVFPAEADISQGRVSIMTPIGTALIGLAKGQSIAWTARDGRKHRLCIIEVEQPNA